jgi:hypothetical protein
MKERGIIQPVTLWLQGMRVIDGFHRSVAAQRLGWNEIPCYVVDCNEDAFWDARIQSARQHHKIENERLTAWIVESWKSSEFYSPHSIDANLLGMYRESPEYLSLIETLWLVYRKNYYRPLEQLHAEREKNGGFVDIRELNTRREIGFPGLSIWLQDKATKWGVGERAIVESILLSSPMKMSSISFGRAEREVRINEAPDRLAIEKDLPFSERQKIAQSLIAPSASRKHYLFDDVREWAENEIIGKPVSTQTVTFDKFLRAKEDGAIQRRKSEEKDKELFAQTPQGLAEAHKVNVRIVKEAMSSVEYRIESIDRFISDSPDFSLPVAEAIATLTNFHNEHFKRKDTKLKDLVTARNAQLRREIKALNDQVASLKRALEAKQVATPKLRNVMVEHSQ